MDLAARLETLRKRFIAWVNRVLKLHQRLTIDGLTISFSHLRYRCGRRPGYLDKWIYYAMDKEVKTLELNFARYFGGHTYYDFPNIDMLSSHSRDSNKFGFGSLKSLRLTGVDIRDEVVQYFLASCPYLEQLCIRGSESTEKVRVVDPLPNLKVLEISNCINIASLEMSVVNLVSCTYQGNKITLPFKEIPNLSELTLGENFAKSFIYEPNKHSSYSAQIVKLTLNIEFYGLRNPSALPLLTKLEHLELNVESPVGKSLHFFTSLIKASPLLNEFKIKVRNLY
ncbi:hypothetical protein PHJA_001197700 [Phtheirospermum japonicum]|uniref:At1g61320/AtMIF1 LRR domain-containing protein n=1 Tax=Phtheirospermum japonicum TaxID=374723 RepID=A0A830BZY3_9LAMI|nr:hypothetical protein PHJA_001197700 [Phtheirospermum japonicum]